MNRVQNGDPIHSSSGMPAAWPSASIDAEERPLVVDESQEARRRADDGTAEVALALELARLPGEVREVADDEDELVVAGGDDAALVLVRLAAQLERVLDLLQAALLDGPTSGLEDEVGDLGRESGVHAVSDDLVGRGRRGPPRSRP